MTEEVYIVCCTNADGLTLIEAAYSTAKLAEEHIATAPPHTGAAWALLTVSVQDFISDIWKGRQPKPQE